MSEPRVAASPDERRALRAVWRATTQHAGARWGEGPWVVNELAARVYLAYDLFRIDALVVPQAFARVANERPHRVEGALADLILSDGPVPSRPDARARDGDGGSDAAGEGRDSSCGRPRLLAQSPAHPSGPRLRGGEIARLRAEVMALREGVLAAVQLLAEGEDQRKVNAIISAALAAGQARIGR